MVFRVFSGMVRMEVRHASRIHWPCVGDNGTPDCILADQGRGMCGVDRRLRLDISWGEQHWGPGHGGSLAWAYLRSERQLALAAICAYPAIGLTTSRHGSTQIRKGRCPANREVQRDSEVRRC